MDQSIPPDNKQARWERVKQWLRLHTSAHGCSVTAQACEELRKIIMETPTKEETADDKHK
jgi:hypothetical protein